MCKQFQGIHIEIQLSLGLKGRGVMRCKFVDYSEFKQKLSQCSDLADVRRLMKVNEETIINLVKQFFSGKIPLMRNISKRLSLK